MKTLRRIFCLYFFLVFLMARGAELRDCDLIFVVSGESAFSDAISSSTARNDSLSFVHVGIIRIGGDSTVNVIEASPEKGVILTPLNEFLDSSCPKIEGNPGAVIKRLEIGFPVERTIENALQYIGQPYDWWYLPGNGKMYCSELIYESYLSDEGEHIFQAAPMNFKAPDGTYPSFWVKLYEELNQPIPQGEPGTNPNALSRDPRLMEIHRYF